jgi:hypothetical protein
MDNDLVSQGEIGRGMSVLQFADWRKLTYCMSEGLTIVWFTSLFFFIIAFPLRVYLLLDFRYLRVGQDLES